jgi:hypothetical protein
MHGRRFGKSGARKVSVPDLSTLTRSQAQTALTNAGFQYTETEVSTPTSNLDLTIKSQSITAGDIVLYGSSISYEYYKYALVAPENTTTPEFTQNGTSSYLGGVGQYVSIGNGVWDYEPTSYTYQWQKAGYGSSSWSNVGTSSSIYLDSSFVGHLIRCTVTATNEIGSTSVTVSPGIIFGPGPLSGLSATLTSNDNVRLTWSAAVGANGYALQYSGTNVNLYDNTNIGDVTTYDINFGSTTGSVQFLVQPINTYAPWYNFMGTYLRGTGQNASISELYPSPAPVGSPGGGGGTPSIGSLTASAPDTTSTQLVTVTVNWSSTNQASYFLNVQQVMVANYLDYGTTEKSSSASHGSGSSFQVYSGSSVTITLRVYNGGLDGNGLPTGTYAEQTITYTPPIISSPSPSPVGSPPAPVGSPPAPVGSPPAPVGGTTYTCCDRYRCGPDDAASGTCGYSGQCADGSYQCCHTYTSSSPC